MASSAYAQDSIRIASVDTLSGPTSAISQGVSRGLQLAVEQINAAGGIKALGGAKIELVEYDTQGKTDLVQSQAEKAISEGAVALIGMAVSGVALPATTVAERAGIPALTSSAVADQLTQRGYKYTFKILSSAAMGRDNIANYLKHFFSGELKLTRLIHVHEDGAFGQSVEEIIYKPLAGVLGYELVSMPFKSGSADMSGLISQLRRQEAEALIFTGYGPDAITFVNSARQARVHFPYFDVGINIQDKNFLATVSAENRDKLIGYQFFNPVVRPVGNEDGPAEFDKAYRARWGEAPALHSANGWTSMMVMAKALEQAGSTDGAKLRDALSAVEFTPADGHILANPSVKFDETGQNINYTMLTVQQAGENVVPVWPSDFATADIILVTE